MNSLLNRWLEQTLSWEKSNVLKYLAVRFLMALLLLLSIIKKLPQRVILFFSHWLEVNKYVKSKKNIHWLVFNFFHLFDVIGIGELLSFLSYIFKPNTRKLNEVEFYELKKVFGENYPYWKIGIDEYSLMAKLGANYNKSKHLGVVIFNTINFTRKLNTKEKNESDLLWLVHEAMHIAQYEKLGSKYIYLALEAQRKEGYDFGGGKNLTNKKLASFNLEQQAEIIKEYYRELSYGGDCSCYKESISSLIKQEFYIL